MKNSTTFTNITSGSENLSLVSGSAAIGAGANLYATLAGLDADITGAARPSSGAWDIGAFKYVTSGGGAAAPTYKNFFRLVK